MNRKKDIPWGDILGWGLTGGFTIGTLAALIHGARRDDDDRLQRCELYYEGNIPGYETIQGPSYPVFVQTPDGAEAICEVPSIWFQSKDLERKYAYDLARNAGLPPGGALLAMAHHMKAGSHTVGSRAPMRGMNLWGVKGGGSWWSNGNPVYIRPTKEYSAKQDARIVVQEAKWRYFDTPEDAAESFLQIMHQWPKARKLLYTKQPNPYEYAWYLHFDHATHGHSYGTGMNDVAKGGIWGWARGVATQMRYGAKMLMEDFGYNGLDWALAIPTITKEDAYELSISPIYGNNRGPYPLLGYP